MSVFKATQCVAFCCGSLSRLKQAVTYERRKPFPPQLEASRLVCVLQPYSTREIQSCGSWGTYPCSHHTPLSTAESVPSALITFTKTSAQITWLRLEYLCVYRNPIIFLFLLGRNLNTVLSLDVRLMCVIQDSINSWMPIRENSYFLLEYIVDLYHTNLPS